jgi:hypothetical protein
MKPRLGNQEHTNCRAPATITWCSVPRTDGATSGGDTQTTHAELQLTRNAPQANGSFIMFGSGPSAREK